MDAEVYKKIVEAWSCSVKPVQRGRKGFRDGLLSFHVR
jgi:hypothetical protein